MRYIAFACVFSLSAVAAPNPDFVRDLSELLSIPSVSANKVETDRAVEWMQAFFEKRGVWCAVEQWPEDGRKVLYAATKPGLKNPDYTIVTHLDVVDAPPVFFIFHSWSASATPRPAWGSTPDLQVFFFASAASGWHQTLLGGN